MKILFVCHGNICRSPMAEYVMKDLVKREGLEDECSIASAATSTEEIGNGVYPPARRKLQEHGISCAGHAARQLRQAFPAMQIVFIVRGGFAQNDATRADARQVGLEFPVLDNGNRVPGTELSLLSKEARQALDQADMIVAKGQGNAETLLGCGYPIWYAFLIKCPRFIARFGRPKLTPMLVREGDV